MLWTFLAYQRSNAQIISHTLETCFSFPVHSLYILQYVCLTPIQSINLSYVGFIYLFHELRYCIFRYVNHTLIRCFVNVPLILIYFESCCLFSASWDQMNKLCNLHYDQSAPQPQLVDSTSSVPNKISPTVTYVYHVWKHGLPFIWWSHIFIVERSSSFATPFTFFNKVRCVNHFLL
jgi:hypothetical protein